MVSEDELKKMADYLSHIPANVHRGMTVVTSSKEDDYLYHISTNLCAKKFEPRVPKRAVEGENISVPRICVGSTITGCIRGYTSDLHDFIAHKSDDENMAGRWMIYGIPYNLAIKPSRELLPDVSRSDEHWLVTYSPETVTYVPVQLGKYFYRSVQYNAKASGYPTIEVDLYLEVLTDTPLQFSHNVTLEKGYWSIKLINLHDADRWNRGFKVISEQITEKEYNDSKHLVASMLSLESFKPASAHWK